ncbi:uncharacterized protein G2W53_017921 [Senna tora]|uniref:Uncharacterized protein n=1 Tax=Senna tora TaxID=362788 RepID=A0A834TRS6_9FABA|nr:uncharacterized protein G2W53_017920 [Senna tora]KAF7826757.1 uncharacterized protein G2W53_017921 [Senna tora]
MAPHLALIEDGQNMKSVKREVVGQSIKRALLTPIQVRNIQSHSIRFKSQGMKHHNFGIGETSRPLILNPRNKASRPWGLWGIETPDFKT